MIRKSMAVGVLGLFAFALIPAHSPAQATSNYPFSVTNAGTRVTFTKAPTRIISLSPTATEMLFAIGAGKQVIAVDDQSNYPTTAPRTALSGYAPNLETILAKKPDLVVISYNPGNLVRSLHQANVKVLFLNATAKIAGSYWQMRLLGRVTNHSDQANRVVTSMSEQIRNKAKEVPSGLGTVKFYHELDNTMYSITSSTFIGSLYRLAKLTNIADQAPGASYGYPQLSAEYIVAANPSLIFLADARCCGQSYSTVSTRPGFSNISAIKNRNVIILNEDIASRWGPRTPQLFSAIVDAVKKLK